MSLKKRLSEFAANHAFTRKLKALYKLLKKVRRTGSYYTRTMFYVEGKKLLYLSVSKVGNTSIKASMYGIAEQEGYREVHNEVHSRHMTIKLKQVKDYPDYYKFTFVRNPFDRLVSCYENKLHTDRAEVGKTIKELIYNRYLLGWLGHDHGFCNFAKKICLIPDKYADRHFVSQSFKAVNPDGSLIVDYVGKFENFANDFEPIREKFGLAPLPHYNHTKKEKKNWMDYYDIKTAKKVYMRYETDIRVFGYQETYDKLIKYLEEKQKKTTE